MPIQRFDILIIGSGPGGYTAAIRAAQLGAKVAIIEKNELGGTCLNRGCIPTKAILESVKLYSKIKKAQGFGLSVEKVSFDWQKIIERKNGIVEKLRKGLETLFKAHGIEVIRGEAKIKDPQNIEIIGLAKGDDNYRRLLRGNSIIIASGSEPSEKMPGLTSTDALNLEKLPEELTIIGGGVMGVEFATIFAELGVKITIREMLDRILPNEDEEVSELMARILKRKGVIIKTSADPKEKTDPAKTLVTIGRTLNLEGLAEAGIKIENNAVKVNDKMQTNIENIYAVGDITNIAQLAHVAMYQGKIAAQNAAKQISTANYDIIPWCVYSFPEIGRVGMTEKQAIASGKKIKASKFPFAASSRALTEDEREGFIKIICDEATNEILGAHIIGPDASELIHELALAKKNGLKASQIAETIHCHPTLSESIEDACEAIFNQSIHFKQ